MITAPSAFTTANIDLVKKPIYLIEIDGYATKFVNQVTGISGQQPWIESIDDFTITVNELEGGADLGEFSFTILDFGQAITASFPSFVFEGKAVTMKTGFVGMSQSDFVTLFTGVVDHVESADANNSYKFICVDNKQLLSQVIYKLADDGQPTDNDHRRTLLGHPLDILLHALEVEAGYATGDIDVTGIEAYRDGIFAGVQFQFSLDSPPTAKDFIENQLLKPLGGYIWVNNVGKISINFFYPSNFAPLVSFDADSITELPEAQQADLVNMLSVRFDKNSEGKFLSESVQEYQTSIDLYGQFGQQIIESDGLRSGLQGFFTVALTAQQIFLRYGLKQLKFDPFHVFWTGCVLEPGDLVAVTHAKVPDRIAGVMGITSKQFVILNRTYHFDSCTVEFVMLDAAFYGKFGRFRYSSDVEANYTAASSPDKARYMFLCNDSDQYSDASPANTLG